MISWCATIESCHDYVMTWFNMLSIMLTHDRNMMQRCRKVVKKTPLLAHLWRPNLTKFDHSEHFWPKVVRMAISGRYGRSMSSSHKNGRKLTKVDEIRSKVGKNLLSWAGQTHRQALIFSANFWTKRDSMLRSDFSTTFEPSRPMGRGWRPFEHL